jgi:hypothetical protein
MAVVQPEGISPGLAQILQILSQGFERRRQVDLQEQALARQREDDQRRYQAQDDARDIQIAGLTQQSAAATPLEKAPQIPLQPGETPPIVLKPSRELELPIPPEAMTGKSVEPITVQKSDVASFNPNSGGPERIIMTLKGGKKVPLAPLGVKPPPLKYQEEVEADAIRQTKAKKEAEADVMDVPEDPGFGSLAGKKGVRTSTVNAYLAMLGRKDVAEANRLTRQYLADAKTQALEAKAQDETNNGRILAQSWAAGTSFPSKQNETTLALKYMDEHPDEFKRRPRKLTATQQDEVLRATDAIATVDDVAKAYQKVKKKIGPVNYTFNEMMRKLPGTKEDPEFTTFNALLRGMGNLEIKRITGAQMSEDEAGRLLKAMATGNMKPGDFEAALAVMTRNAKRNREITLYGDVQPDGGPIVDGDTTKGVAPKKTLDQLLTEHGHN